MAAPSLLSLDRRFAAIYAEYQELGADHSLIESKVDALFASLEGLASLLPDTKHDPKYLSLAKNIRVLQENLQHLHAPYDSAAMTGSVARAALPRTSASFNLLALAPVRGWGGSAVSTRVVAAAMPSRDRALTIEAIESGADDDEMKEAQKKSFSAFWEAQVVKPAMPDTSRRRMDEVVAPPIEKPHGVSIQTGEDGTPILSYVIAQEKVGFGAEPTSFLDRISSLDSSVKKQLKLVLQAIDHPTIKSFHSLSIAADVIVKIAGIKVPASWDTAVLSNVYARLSDVAIEEPVWENPSILGHEKLHKQIRWVVENLPDETVHAFESSIRALLVAAPYLIPSYAMMLATQAYHKTLPGKLSPPLWTKEDPALQLLRILYFIHTPTETPTSILIRQVSSLDPFTKAALKTMLHSILIQISGLTTEQRIYYANEALSKTMPDAKMEHTADVLRAVYESLESSPVIYPTLSTPACEGFDSLKTIVQETVQYIPVEDLRALNVELQSILFAAQILPSDQLLVLTNAAIVKHGFSLPSWTDEEPAIQILRYLHFATSPAA